jgi:hypothetical protein
MAELSDLIASVDAEEQASYRDTIAAIKKYDVERANETMSKAAKDTAGNVLRDFFKTHPDEQELVDTEWNLRAYMQNGGRTNVYEHPNVVKAQNPKAYARFEQLGLFRFDDKAVEKALADGLLTHGDLAGFAHEGERSPSLQVKAIKR